MKFLIWAVIGFLVVSWLMRGKKTSKQMNASQASSKNAEPILQCAHCGLHVPASEAIITQTGVIFCCDEHRVQQKKSASQ